MKSSILIRFNNKKKFRNEIEKSDQSVTKEFVINQSIFGGFVVPITLGESTVKLFTDVFVAVLF